VEVVVRETPFAAEGIRALPEIQLVRPNGTIVASRAVASARMHGSDLLVRFAGVSDADAAAELRGLYLEVHRSAYPDAGPGQIYHADLLGLEVFDEMGRSIGRIRRVIATGANEVLEVDGKSGEILIPYHPGTVLGWDPALGRITVRLPEGLEDIYRNPPPSQG